MIRFVKETRDAVFLNPRNQFIEKRVAIERRINPLTGETGWVLPYGFRLKEPKDLQPLIEQSLKIPCPFCPDLIRQGTPKFVSSIAEKGRITRGEVTIVPNLFPYEPYSAVARLTERHFVPMADFTEQILLDGLMASLDYLERIRSPDPDLRYGSINWNYMPPAGGGIIHPHFQPVASPYPTQYMDKIGRASSDFYRLSRDIFWDRYIKEEEEKMERFIGRIGQVSFLAPFAPRNMTGEILAVFEQQDTVYTHTESYFHSFSEGLHKILQGLSAFHFTSLNMALYLFFQPQEGVWTTARIVPRAVFPALDTADVNYYEKLHDEVFCMISPEDMCSHLRPYFT
jgi:galactose-1-phosphate uridylyltransferase